MTMVDNQGQISRDGEVINASGQIIGVSQVPSQFSQATLWSPTSSSDSTPPTITLTTPPDGAQYTIGQAVNAVYSLRPR